MKLWRLITIMVIVVGAIVSLLLMFDAGRDQKSIFLMALFTGWVLAPFIIYTAVTFISQRWSDSAQATLYGLVLFLCVLSLIIYNGTFDVPGTKPAFKFLMAPLVSLTIIVVTFAVVQRLEKRRKTK
jgi:uncharacterized membrane protein YhaH (DUF805 family)